MATIEELAAKVAGLEQQMAAITVPPTEYYTSIFSGEDIDAAIKKVNDGIVGGVSSFNGRIGAVKPQAGDYNATQIPVSGEPEAETVATALSNKAPAGYGLGGNAIMTDSPDYNLDNISGSGWFVGVPKMDNFTFGSCLVENIQWAAGEGAQIAFLYPGTSSPAVYNTRIQRTKFNYAFGPWEWINPPMQLGIEYRTAERHNGQPVYAKAISFGKAPNASSKDISHGIENFGQLVSYTGMLDGANLIQNSMVDNIRINASAIRITTNTDASECYVYLTLYYTKTTD